MSNMSYCRFQNTSKDFDDCAEAIRDLENFEAGPLSSEELRAAKSMYGQALEMLQALAERVGVDLEELDDDDIDKALDELNDEAKRHEEEQPV